MSLNYGILLLYFVSFWGNRLGDLQGHLQKKLYTENSIKFL